MISGAEISGSKHFGYGGGMSLPEPRQSTFIRDNEESRIMVLQKKIDQLTSELIRKETVIQYEQDKNEWYRRVLNYESKTRMVGSFPTYRKIKSYEFMGESSFPNKND